MYTAFYGLREKPFSLSPNPRFLFLAESHREALAHLLYGIDEGEGFIAITGEVGTGKTTICRTLLERLGSDTEVAFLFNPSASGGELMRAIASEFGLDIAEKTPAELGEDLNRFLLEKKHEDHRVLLIVDESQNLSAETLEQLRLLSNLETASSKLIQILLLGQPELDRKLETSELRQLRQRIGVRWRLEPLSLAETGEYIRYRLRIAAGAERDLFEPAAVREVYRRSGGVPRLINILCDRSLLAGYAEGETRISRRTIRQAAKEIPAAAGRRVATATRAASTAGSRWRLGAAFALGGLVALLGGLALIVGFPSLSPLGGNGEIDVAAAPPAALETPTADIAAVAAIPDDLLVEVHEERGPGWLRVEPAADPVLLDTGASRAPIELASIAPIAPLAKDSSGFLGPILQRQEPGAGRLQAVNAILESFGVEEIARIPRSETEALIWLEERGLGVLPVYGADLDLLRTLNYPVLLRLRTDAGEPRLVALRRLGADLGSLHGVTGRGPLDVQVGEIESQWDGRAFVVWRGFESLPERIALGESGVAVLWLQDALRELGHFQGEASGQFDVATQEAVRELQVSRSIEADGIAGPRTLMILYQLLERYDAPDLVMSKGQSA